MQVQTLIVLCIFGYVRRLSDNKCLEKFTQVVRKNTNKTFQPNQLLLNLIELFTIERCKSCIVRF